MKFEIAGTIEEAEYSAYSIFPIDDEANPIKSRDIPWDKIDCLDFGGGAGAFFVDPPIFDGLGSIKDKDDNIITSGSIIRINVGGATHTIISVVGATGMVSFN